MTFFCCTCYYPENYIYIHNDIKLYTGLYYTNTVPAVNVIIKGHNMAAADNQVSEPLSMDIKGKKRVISAAYGKCISLSVYIMAFVWLLYLWLYEYLVHVSIVRCILLTCNWAIEHTLRHGNTHTHHTVLDQQLPQFSALEDMKCRARGSLEFYLSHAIKRPSRRKHINTRPTCLMGSSIKVKETAGDITTGGHGSGTTMAEQLRPLMHTQKVQPIAKMLPPCTCVRKLTHALRS